MREEVIERASALIRSDIGNLEGINPELANTIANIYCRFFDFVPANVQGIANALRNSVVSEFAQSMTGRLPFPNRVEHINALLTKSLNGTDGKLLSEYAFVIACIEEFPNTIKGLRDLQAEVVDGRLSSSDKNAVEQMLINVFKYRILDASTKSPLRCMIERKLRSSPDETPGLLRQLRLT